MSEDAWHVVLVPERGHVICSCAGVNWCSHIEATLVAGERAMVSAEDRDTANRAQIAARGRIGPPDGWQSHWRTNRRWRGLPPARMTSLHQSRETGRPMMSIEGRGGARRDVATLSREAGWMVVAAPVLGCIFHVAPDSTSCSPAAERARASGIPIASYDEWMGMADSLAAVMAHEIGLRAEGTKRLQDERQRD